MFPHNFFRNCIFFLFWCFVNCFFKMKKKEITQFSWHTHTQHPLPTVVQKKLPISLTNVKECEDMETSMMWHFHLKSTPRRTNITWFFHWLHHNFFFRMTTSCFLLSWLQLDFQRSRSLQSMDSPMLHAKKLIDPISNIETWHWAHYETCSFCQSWMPLRTAKTLMLQHEVHYAGTCKLWAMRILFSASFCSCCHLAMESFCPCETRVPSISSEIHSRVVLHICFLPFTFLLNFLVRSSMRTRWLFHFLLLANHQSGIPLLFTLSRSKTPSISNSTKLSPQRTRPFYFKRLGPWPVFQRLSAWRAQVWGKQALRQVFNCVFHLIQIKNTIMIEIE